MFDPDLLCRLFMCFVYCATKCQLPYRECVVFGIGLSLNECKIQYQLAGLIFRLTHLGQQTLLTLGQTKGIELGKLEIHCACLILAEVNRGPIFPRLSGSLLTLAKEIT